MPNPSIEALRAYRDRLKKLGRLDQAKTVERCIVLVRSVGQSSLPPCPTGLIERHQKAFSLVPYSLDD